MCYKLATNRDRERKKKFIDHEIKYDLLKDRTSCEFDFSEEGRGTDTRLLEVSVHCKVSDFV